jgi:hypothetical protein
MEKFVGFSPRLEKTEICVFFVKTAAVFTMIRPCPVLQDPRERNYRAIENEDVDSRI